jgi:ABC-type transporter Mla maintaining outer membrane lipid asymmetry ATPase subunit MlaF
VLLGPSGTGKSVFLKALIGLLRPERGKIIVDGTNIIEWTAKELYEIRTLFGVMFQDGALFGSMSLYDNTASGRNSTANTRSSRLHRRPPRRVRGRAHHHRPAQCRGGGGPEHVLRHQSQVAIGAGPA